MEGEVSGFCDYERLGMAVVWQVEYLNSIVNLWWRFASSVNCTASCFRRTCNSPKQGWINWLWDIHQKLSTWEQNQMKSLDCCWCFTSILDLDTSERQRYRRREEDSTVQNEMKQTSKTFQTAQLDNIEE